jgi:hypothetical protein
MENSNKTILLILNVLRVLSGVNLRGISLSIYASVNVCC